MLVGSIYLSFITAARDLNCCVFLLQFVRWLPAFSIMHTNRVHLKVHGAKSALSLLSGNSIYLLPATEHHRNTFVILSLPCVCLETLNSIFVMLYRTTAAL